MQISNNRMKINEYIDSHFLTIENVTELRKMYVWMRNHGLSHALAINNSEDMLEHQKMKEVLNSHQDKILFVDNIDIDFPPPQKPWRYDKYFHLFPFQTPDVPYHYKVQHSLLPILEKNNLFVVAYSVSIHHPRVLSLPCGVSNRFYQDAFGYKTKDKTILCYANFGIPVDRWFGNPRKECMKIFQTKDFITMESNKTQDHFYQTIAQSKFTLCPRGCGIDTYRCWDAICLGSIPIVEKTDGHEQWKKLPIWFINSWNDFESFTEETLNERYEMMMQQEYNYEKLTLDFWLNLFIEKNEELRLQCLEKEMKNETNMVQINYEI